MRTKALTGAVFTFGALGVTAIACVVIAYETYQIMRCQQQIRDYHLRGKVPTQHIPEWEANP